MTILIDHNVDFMIEVESNLMSLDRVENIARVGLRNENFEQIGTHI